MTIAAGVVCPNGIVLAADSQETVGGYLKVFKPKLVELPLISTEAKAIVVAAGDGPFIDVLVEAISEKLDSVNPYLGSSRQAIQNAITETCDNVWPHYSTQSDKPQARLLIGLRALDGITMLDAFVPMVRTADPYAFIGWGGDLATYKAKQLLLAGLPLDVASPLVAHILQIVKDNVEYCGGQTRLATLTTDGIVEHKTQAYIETAERGYKTFATGIETLLTPLLSAMFLPDGKTALSEMAALGETEVDDATKQGLVSTISEMVNMKSALRNPDQNSLAKVGYDVAVAIQALDKVWGQFYLLGLITEQSHQSFRDAIAKLIDTAREALGQIKDDKVDQAKRSLMMVMSILTDVVGSMQLGARTSMGRQ